MSTSSKTSTAFPILQNPLRPGDAGSSLAARPATREERAPVIIGTPGDDILGRDMDDASLPTGANDLAGGTGNDWYFIDDLNDTVTEAVGEGAVDRVFVRISGYTVTAGAEIEIISTDNHAGTTAIDIVGNAFSQRIQGNEGASVLSGRDGDDLLAGMGGDDVLNGDEGADYLNGGAGNDVLNGGLGIDQMFGGLGDDIYYIDNAAERPIEVAGQGNDTVRTSVSYVLGSSLSIETLETTDAAGTAVINLTGNNQAQRINGNAGANILNGGGGINEGAGDILVGGLGDDWYFVYGEEQIIEGAGEGVRDRLFAYSNYNLADDVHIEVMSTADHDGTQDIGLRGNNLANLIYGNAGSNDLRGNGGADVIRGGAGLDYVAGGEGDDVLYGEGGDDHVYGEEGDDRLFGGLGEDEVYFSGRFSEYVLTDLGGGRYIITDKVANRDGSDYIEGFEWVSFYDIRGSVVTGEGMPVQTEKEQAPQVLPGHDLPGALAALSTPSPFLADAWNDWAY